jgi:hypothetical protein
MYQASVLLKWFFQNKPFEGLRISERLLLEEAYSPYHGEVTIAHIGLEDWRSISKKGIPYLDFFLLVCALVSNWSATWLSGAVGADISNFDELGKPNTIYSDYMKKKNILWKLSSEDPIIPVKNRFLELEEDMQEIMDGYLRIALRYYYFAIQAYYREPRRIDEILIDLAISAEALFSTGGRYAKNLRSRLSNFIANKETEEAEIAKNIGSFYRLRGAIVHGGRKKKVNFNDIRIAQSYIKKSIDKALSLKLYEKNDLLQLIELAS